jgi:tetratricopeptide (TPR) repeat protein
MEMDALFLDEDFYVGGRLYYNHDLMRTVLARDDPSFIAAPLKVKGFNDLIKAFPEYVPVFFDDIEALYVNQRHYPGIAQRYGLNAIEPFELVTQDVEVIFKREDLDAVIREVRRLLEIYPDGGSTNYLVGLLFNDAKTYDRALPHAETYIRNFPEQPKGYWLKAEAYKGLGLLDQALTNYEASLNREENPDSRRAIYKEIGLVQFERRQYAKAYRAFSKGLDLLSSFQDSVEDFYTLSLTALLSGKTQEAKAILVYLAEYRIPAEDTFWRTKVETALHELSTR